MDRGGSDSLARVVTDSLRDDASVVDPEQLERIGSHLCRQTKRHDAATLAVLAGCRIRRYSEQEPESALLTNGVIAVRLGCDKHRAELAFLQGAANWLLRSHAHSRGDVWRLALILAMPRPLSVRMTTADVGSTARIPQWAIEARLAMPTARAKAYIITADSLRVHRSG